VIPWQFVDLLETDPARRVKLKIAYKGLAQLHPADIADIVEDLAPAERESVFETIDEEVAAEALEEIEPDIQVSIVESLDKDRAADILEEMDPDDAADILGDLEPEQARDLLARMEAEDAEDVRELLTYPDDTAGGLMTTDLVAVPPTVTAQEAIGLVRQQAAEMDNVYQVYVVDSEEHLLGDLSLRELIVAHPDTAIGRVMHRELIRGRLDDDADEIARIIAKYNLLSLPIVDDSGRLKGIVTVDDAMDVILPDDWKARLPRIYAHA
jgi:Mg2+ transporter MgtE